MWVDRTELTRRIMARVITIGVAGAAAVTVLWMFAKGGC